MVYSVGTPVVSAIVRTVQGDTTVAKKIAFDDALTKVTLANYPEDIVIDSATVKGFTLKALQRPMLNHHAIFDGVPAYLREDLFDPTQHHFGLIEETAEINEVLLEIPGKTEEEKPTTTKVPLHRIKAFEGGKEVEVSSAGGDSAETDETP